MEIRRSLDRLISTMGFPILVRWQLYIESGPRTWFYNDWLHLLVHATKRSNWMPDQWKVVIKWNIMDVTTGRKITRSHQFVVFVHMGCHVQNSVWDINYSWEIYTSLQIILRQFDTQYDRTETRNPVISYHHFLCIFENGTTFWLTN